MVAHCITLPTYIYPWAAVVGPDNPRTAYHFDLPASGRDGTVPPRPTNRPAGALQLEVASQDHIVATINASSTLLGLDAWNESVRDAGVLQAITVVPVEITYQDRTDSVVVLMTEDGATRLANWRCNAGVFAAWDLLYEFTRTGSTRARSFIADINRIVDTHTPESISDEDAARLRSAVVPVSIILGFEPDDATQSGGLVEALASFKGQLHIAQPEPWPPGTQRDEQLLEALAALYDPSGHDFDWRTGRLTPEEAVALGLSPEVDDALAVLVDLAPYHQGVNNAIRRLNAAEPQRGAEDPDGGC